MGRAFFRLSPTRLANALHMPISTEIVGIDWDWQHGVIRVYVEDDTFLHHFAGEPITECKLMVTCHTRDPLPGEMFHGYMTEWKMAANETALIKGTS